MKIASMRERKAISPIIATVLIIAATLIAFAAIGGYMFGILGSGTSTANVAVTTVSAKSGALGAQAAPCTASTTAPYIDITLSNTGSAGTTAASVTLTFGGSTVTQATSGSCSVAASGSTGPGTVSIGFVPATATGTGETFTGYVTLANGAEASFTGTFA